MSRFLGRRNSSDSDCKIAGLYDLEETIGRGHFAVVKLARHVFTGEKVAVKVIDKTKLDDVSKAHLFQEVRCMKLVQHPHVVRLYEVIDTQTKLYLILELGDGGDMYDHIMKFSGGLDEALARRYFKQIVQAISYCHKLHVVHRDLKPENVVFFEKQGIVKLTDFGFSNKFIPGMKLETSCGSLAYSAPEILLGDSYDAPAVDIWSLGVILYMLVCGTPPFQEANDSETLTMIMDCKYDIHDHVSDSCKDLISTLLIRDPNRRSTLDDILNHPWLKVGDVSCAPMTLMPLISRGFLPDEDHQRIIDRMVNGAIAPRDEILKALERNEYNHIAATYYLLAERCLRKQQEQQASHLNVQQLRKNSAPSPKMKLEPLALSPRVQPKDNQMALIFSQTAQAVNALISPPEEMDEDGTPHRRCSLITEESDEDDNSDLEMKRVHSLENTRNAYSAPSDGSRNKPMSSSPEDSPTNTDAQTANVQARTKPHPSNRALHQVRSSPQLLNQICEEGESDDELIAPRLGGAHMLQRKTIASPEVIRKIEARRKRYTASPRGTSCSSSDASDNDETENQKKREKLKHRIHRRDSDQSSDTDGPSGPGCGGNSGNGPNPQGGSAQDDNNGGGGGGGGKGGGNDGNSSSQGGGNSNNSSGKQQNVLSCSPIHNQCEDFANGVLKEVARKISNFSGLSSNLSINSLSSNASKGSRYIVDSVSSTPRHGKDRDVQFLNELNKVKSRVNRASFDFSDLRDTLATEYGREDRISICSADCPQFNPGKLKRRLKNKFKTDINKNGVILESVTPVQELANDDKTRSKCCSVI